MQRGNGAFRKLGRLADFHARDLGRQFPRDAFVEEQVDRPHVRVRMEPADEHVLTQHIADGREAHALMMRHICTHRHEPAAFALAIGREVRRLEEAIAADQPHAGKLPQVAQRLFGAHRERERGRIGRNDEIPPQPATQAEVRHAKGMVAIAAVMSHRGEGRFRNAPRHVIGPREILLHVDCAAVALAQQGHGIAPQEDVRHQILEHRAVPGYQRKPRRLLGDRPAEVEPVLGRHIALGDREEAGEPCLARQQVVMMGVYPVGAHIIADVEQAIAAIEQDREVHGMGGRAGLPGNLPESLAQGRQCRPPAPDRGQNRLHPVELVALGQSGAIAQPFLGAIEACFEIGDRPPVPQDGEEFARQLGGFERRSGKQMIPGREDGKIPLHRGEMMIGTLDPDEDFAQVPIDDVRATGDHLMDRLAQRREVLDEKTVDRMGPGRVILGRAADIGAHGRQLLADERRVGEAHRPEAFDEKIEQILQTVPQSPVQRAFLRHLAQRLRDRHETDGEIAAVDGRDIARFERIERARVVPVQDVAAILLQPGKRREGVA